MDAVRINQIHLCSMICKNTASTCKYKQTYHDIWWYMMIYINSSSVGELTHPGDNQRASRTKNPRRKRAEQATSCASGPLSSCTDIMNFDDIWWYLMIFEYRWCLHISHDVFTCLQTFTVCLPMFVYPCISMYSKQINVYPCISLIREAVGATCIHLHPCYILLHFFTLFYFVLFHVDSFLCIMVHQFAPIHASRKHRSKGRQDSWVANTRPVLVWASGVQVFLCTLHHITSHYCMSTVGLYVPLISFTMIFTSPVIVS